MLRKITISKIKMSKQMKKSPLEPELFNAANIHEMQWPQNPIAEYTRKYITPIIQNGIDHYVDNIQGEMLALKIDQYVFPVIIPRQGVKNSYICSPYEHYISYGSEATKLIDNKLIAGILKKLINGLGKIGELGKINSVVYVNHWLFSTDLYPKDLTAEHFSAIADFLKHRFPSHALVFRSLNEIIYSPLETAIKQAGFKLLASRQVHVTDTKDEHIFQTRIVKSDIRLWSSGKYQVYDENQITEAECDELLKLYNTLYIEQHSDRNPRYNSKFIKHLFKEKLLHFRVIKQGSLYKGVAGFYIKNDVMMCPLFGYDKTDPDHTMIYRMLSTALLMAAKEKKLIFHQSAGASFYKALRRAKNCKESMAIYSSHLPCAQKLSWTALMTFVNTFAPRYMKKY